MVVMFNHSVMVQDQALAEGVQSFDLAVNPLSVILIALRPLNDTGTLANYQDYLGVCGALNRVTVEYRGKSVVSMTGRDLAALNYYRHGMIPMESNPADTNDDRRCVVLPVLMGRHAYDPKSCFPATRRGELVLSLDADIADTGYNGLRASVETIELLGAKPSHFEQKVQNQQTNGATGLVDVDLPVGNDVRGVLLFGTTGFTGATPAPSWGRIATMLDNVQFGYSQTDFEVARVVGQLWGRQPPRADAHIHRVDATGGAAEATGPAVDVGAGGWENYAFLDFDVTKDDMFSLPTRGASRFHLRADVETADAVRAVAIERIPLSELGEPSSGPCACP